VRFGAALTEKDREDVQDAVKIGVDYWPCRRAASGDIEDCAARPGTTKLGRQDREGTGLDKSEKIVASDA